MSIFAHVIEVDRTILGPVFTVASEIDRSPAANGHIHNVRFGNGAPTVLQHHEQLANGRPLTHFTHLGS